MNDGQPTPESFQQELETVIHRHHELFEELTGYAVAMLLQEADYQRAKYNTDLTEIEHAGDGVWIVRFGDDMAAVLGAGRDASKLQGLDADVAMVGSRGMFDA